MKSKFRNIFRVIWSFFVKMTEDRVGVYTAQASFFIIISLFPFILLLITLISFTRLDQSFIASLASAICPSSVRPLLTTIIEELYTRATSTTVSISAVGAIWLASKGVCSIMLGIYNVCKINERRNYWITRAASILYTLVFITALAITMVLLVFGNRLFHLIEELIPILKNLSIMTFVTRYILVFLLLTVFFIIIYRIANFRNATFSTVLPGALFASIGWLVFSYVFSVYVDNFSNISYLYGSITAFIVLMLWIYFCIYIFFIGSEINEFCIHSLASKAIEQK